MTTSRSKDTAEVVIDTVAMLRRLEAALDVAAYQGDDETVRWIWRNILSVEKRRQERA